MNSLCGGGTITGLESRLRIENLAGNTLILISQKRAGVRGGGQGEYSGPAQACCIELLWGSVGRLLAGPRGLSIFWVVRRLQRRLSCQHTLVASPCADPCALVYCPLMGRGSSWSVVVVVW